MTTFVRVQEILNAALLAWENRTHPPPIIAKLGSCFAIIGGR